MEGKKKRKNYFSNQGNDGKKRKRLMLECGMKGFLCTCNFREKDCVREAYNLLNEYAEKVYGPTEKQVRTTSYFFLFFFFKLNTFVTEKLNSLG